MPDLTGTSYRVRILHDARDPEGPWVYACDDEGVELPAYPTARIAALAAQAVEEDDPSRIVIAEERVRYLDVAFPLPILPDFSLDFSAVDRAANPVHLHREIDRLGEEIDRLRATIARLTSGQHASTEHGSSGSGRVCVGNESL